MIHGNQTASVPEAYRRYLANVFRESFDLYATPVAVEFRTDVNPYDRRRRAGAPRRRQEQCRVDKDAVERHAEVQVRPGHPAGGTDLADDRAGAYGLARRARRSWTGGSTS